MIEINLIPDVKREMIHAQKMRNTAIGFSIMAALAAGGVVVLLAVLVGVQMLHESLARGEITKQFTTLQKTADIDKALTIQSQLGSISELNDKKTIDSRLLDVVAAVNPPAPNDVKFSSIQLDPTTNTLSLEGMAANSFQATETLRKLILNTKVESGEGEVMSTPLTDEVTISDASYGENSDGQRVLSFKASFIYPAGLFDNTFKNVRIVTPNSKVDVTDSRTRVPMTLFSAPATKTEGAN